MAEVLTDIRLTDDFEIAAAANGDASTVSSNECFIQELRLEALSTEGELFYDKEWGWSLLDFIQTVQDDLIELEIKQRVRTKLLRKNEIIPDSIEIELTFDANQDSTVIKTRFKLFDEDDYITFDVGLNRVDAKVVVL